MLTFKHKGTGLLNSAINNLPFELHLPFHQFCGPGTKLEKRIKRGDLGINLLDAACKDHDIAYSKNKSLEERHKADWVLENKAWERVKSKDSKLGEKAAAWLVTTGMKVKRKLGMGIKKKRKQPISFKRGVVDKVKKYVQDFGVSDGNSLKKSATAALKAARVAIKKAGGRKNIRVPRIIPFEFKQGGFLPLLPLLGALGAIGSLAGGASAVAKTIIDTKNAKKKLEELGRHNRVMEEIGKKGSGLYLRRNAKGGYGLFLKKQQKNYQ